VHILFFNFKLFNVVLVIHFGLDTFFRAPLGLALLFHVNQDDHLRQAWLGEAKTMRKRGHGTLGGGSGSVRVP
jgi:hypothetical protein